MRYGDGTAQRSGGGGDGKSRGRKQRRAATSEALKCGQEEWRSHAAAFSSLAWSRRWPRARLETRRRSPAVRCRPWVLFTEITELPLALKPKLLPNLSGNSKISKNKSCSKFNVLQLCFYKHTLSRSTFWNASLNSKGDTLRIYAFSKYFKFYKNNFENSKKTTLYNLTSSTLLLLGSTPKCA